MSAPKKRVTATLIGPSLRQGNVAPPPPLLPPPALMQVASQGIHMATAPEPDEDKFSDSDDMMTRKAKIDRKRAKGFDYFEKKLTHRSKRHNEFYAEPDIPADIFEKKRAEGKKLREAAEKKRAESKKPASSQKKSSSLEAMEALAASQPEQQKEALRKKEEKKEAAPKARRLKLKYDEEPKAEPKKKSKKKKESEELDRPATIEEIKASKERSKARGKKAGYNLGLVEGVQLGYSTVKDLRREYYSEGLGLSKLPKKKILTKIVADKTGGNLRWANAAITEKEY